MTVRDLVLMIQLWSHRLLAVLSRGTLTRRQPSHRESQRSMFLGLRIIIQRSNLWMSLPLLSTAVKEHIEVTNSRDRIVKYSMPPKNIPLDQGCIRLLVHSEFIWIERPSLICLTKVPWQVLARVNVDQPTKVIDLPSWLLIHRDSSRVNQLIRNSILFMVGKWWIIAVHMLLNIKWLVVDQHRLRMLATDKI